MAVNVVKAYLIVSFLLTEISLVLAFPFASQDQEIVQKNDGRQSHVDEDTKVSWDMFLPDNSNNNATMRAKRSADLPTDDYVWFELDVGSQSSKQNVSFAIPAGNMTGDNAIAILDSALDERFRTVSLSELSSSVSAQEPTERLSNLVTHFQGSTNWLTKLHSNSKMGNSKMNSKTNHSNTSLVKRANNSSLPGSFRRPTTGNTALTILVAPFFASALGWLSLRMIDQLRNPHPDVLIPSELTVISMVFLAYVQLNFVLMPLLHKLAHLALRIDATAAVGLYILNSNFIRFARLISDIPADEWTSRPLDPGSVFGLFVETGSTPQLARDIEQPPPPPARAPVPPTLRPAASSSESNIELGRGSTLLRQLESRAGGLRTRSRGGNWRVFELAEGIEVVQTPGQAVSPAVQNV